MTGLCADHRGPLSPALQIGEPEARVLIPRGGDRRDGRYYCTHPPGLGVVLALAYVLLGSGSAAWVNPFLASISLVLAFLSCRRSIGPYWALLAATLVGLNPFANEHALFGDTHIAVQFFLLSALYCLAQISSRGASVAWGAAAGLLAGSIPALQYPEILYLPALVL